MVGDDIVNDVGGAQACGIHGVQVRTGKFRYVIIWREALKQSGKILRFCDQLLIYLVWNILTIKAFPDRRTATAK